MKNAVVIIPCRWGSSRLPGKPLLLLSGKPLIQHVYERASGVKEAFQVLVATDDGRIEKAVTSFGGQVIRTSKRARSGSDRLAEIMDEIKSDIYINLQADELIDDSDILDKLILSFSKEKFPQMGTLKKVLTDPSEIRNPNVVKVVTNAEGQALYFSRAPIPYNRTDGPKLQLTSTQKPVQKTKTPPSLSGTFNHMGIYAFERDTLRLFGSLPTGFLEKHEGLEQLRALENGIKIKVWETRHESFRIDTRADLLKVQTLMKRKQHT